MKKTLLMLFAPLAFLLPLNAAEASNIAFVNIKGCLEKSKLGNQEKTAFENLKKQLSEKLEKSDKELSDIAKKLEDQDYMDSLSPSAEKELKSRFQTLGQELTRAQNHSYQLLNQANMKMVQTMVDVVSSASEVVRAKHNYSCILNREAAFAVSLDVTDEVVQEMDRQFDKKANEKK